MQLTIDKVLKALRMQPSPEGAWAAVLFICRADEPSGVWDALPELDLSQDIERAAKWLSDELSRLPKVHGVYLGLDTLNMKAGTGHNVEIGVTANCDPDEDNTDWAYGGLRYGNHFLVRGLLVLHSVYSQPRWQPQFNFCDYVLFLTYSGIVLGHAFERVPAGESYLAVWGFHDGDLFTLGRNTEFGWGLICK